ncbi:MAG: hypothetical protein CVV44_10350 [Spirochaetae bacterium HGW-Spirochaetae-1]|jgi:glyoxylase-like metal-dependent hydrolase (beta-lactamase superfamily II)|nr:MAG: hypothetical protein CVV44_10350 [Spirochaetae bacterium HGW-Spirochaetae-1]
MKKKNKRILFLLAGILILCLIIAVLVKPRHGGDTAFVEIGFSRMYLLPCRGGYILIDTYYPHSYDKFLSGLKGLGIDVHDISYILLTHHHDDHCGFAARLRRESGARLILHRNAVDNLKIGKPDMNMHPLNACTYYSFRVFSLFKDSSDHSYPPVEITMKDHIVPGNDNDVLRSLGVEGRIVYTPGHTDDSISVVMDDGRAFVGDAAMNLLNYCFCRRRPIWLADMGEVYTGWERLADSGARVIYPAHGEPFGMEELKLTMAEYTSTEN